MYVIVMGDSSVDGNLMDLDLNQEPLDPPVSSALGLGSLLNELETAHGRIEERIRQLEAVTLRARMRQSWRRVRNSETNTALIGATMVNADDEGRTHNGEESGVVAGRNISRGRCCQIDSSFLVAKALEMDSDIKKKVHEDDGNFFDCNVCFYMAKEPILTCCGHLFCWACFFKLPYVDSTTKECPNCKGEVSDSTIVPIYGNGDCTRESNSGSSITVPPRPKAQRVESVRQQRLTRGVSHVRVAEALRRIRTSIGVGDSPQEDSASVSLIFGTSPTENEEAIGVRRLRSRQFSRVLSESAASLSSISSELNSAENLVMDLETFMNRHILQRSLAQSLSTADGDSRTRNGAISQLDRQPSTEGISSVVPVPSSSRTNDGSNIIQRMEDSETSTAGRQRLPPTPASSSSRRRSGSSRVPDVDYGVAQESRRRRLN